MTITINKTKLRQWSIAVLLVSASTLNIVYGIRAGIRMVDDPKPQYNRMKVKLIEDGQVAFIYYDSRTPYKVGDMFTYIVRDEDGAVVSQGPRVVVLELVEVKNMDDDDLPPKSFLDEKPVKK